MQSVYEVKPGSTVQSLNDPGEFGKVVSIDERTGAARVRWPGPRLGREKTARLRVVLPPVRDPDFNPPGCRACREVATVDRFSEPRTMQAGTMFVAVHHVFRMCASCGVMQSDPEDHDYIKEGRDKANALQGFPEDFPLAPLALVEDWLLRK